MSARPGADPSQVALGRFVRGLLVLLCVELLVLAATGTYLFFRYRPEAAAAWADIFGGEPAGVQTWRRVHRWTSSAAIATAIVVVVLLVAAGIRRLRRWVPGAALVLVVLAASFTGFLLPWDQLALWAVTVGTDMRGFRPLWTGDVRFVLVGGAEVGASTMRWWTVVHLALGVVAVLLTASNMRSIRSGHGLAEPADPVERARATAVRRPTSGGAGRG